MALQRRKFTTGQKIYVLKQAEELGVTKVLREHKLSYSVFARWKQQLKENKSSTSADALRLELDNLVEENRRLKKIIANQALDLEIKSEQIKKMESTYHSK